MKKITTKLKPFNFLISGFVPLEINEVGVEVSDTDAQVMVDRLGGNITVTDVDTPIEAEIAPITEEVAPADETVNVVETPAEEVAPAETVNA